MTQQGAPGGPRVSGLQGQTGFHLTKIPNCWVICNYLPYTLLRFLFVLSSGSHNWNPFTRGQISTYQAKRHTSHHVTADYQRVHLKSRFLIKAFSGMPNSSLGFSSSTSHFGFINGRLRALLWSLNKPGTSLVDKGCMKVSLGHELPALSGLYLGDTKGAGRPSSTVPPLTLFMSLLEQKL